MVDGWVDKIIFKKFKINNTMQIRFQNSPKETSQMNTQQLREKFLVQNIMQPGKIELVYSHFDRLIIGGAVPTTTP